MNPNKIAIIKTLYEPEIQQLKFHQDESLGRVIYGDALSGKTHAGFMEGLYHTLAYAGNYGMIVHQSPTQAMFQMQFLLPANLIPPRQDRINRTLTFSNGSVVCFCTPADLVTGFVLRMRYDWLMLENPRMISYECHRHVLLEIVRQRLMRGRAEGQGNGYWYIASETILPEWMHQTVLEMTRHRFVSNRMYIDENGVHHQMSALMNCSLRDGRMYTRQLSRSQIREGQAIMSVLGGSASIHGNPRQRGIWSPIISYETHNNGVVLKVIDWAEGVGDKPPTGYVGISAENKAVIVESIEDARIVTMREQMDASTVITSLMDSIGGKYRKPKPDVSKEEMDDFLKKIDNLLEDNYTDEELPEIPRAVESTN